MQFLDFFSRYRNDKHKPGSFSHAPVVVVYSGMNATLTCFGYSGWTRHTIAQPVIVVNIDNNLRTMLTIWNATQEDQDTYYCIANLVHHPLNLYVAGNLYPTQICQLW